MEQLKGQTLKLNTLLSVIIVLVGIALVIYMIRVEDELGALPLALIVIGLAWFVRIRLSQKP